MSATYSPARRHCLLAVARRHGCDLTPAVRLLRAVPTALLAVALLLLLVSLHLVAAVLVERQRRRRRLPATPTIPPVVPTAPVQALPVEVPTGQEHTATPVVAEAPAVEARTTPARIGLPLAPVWPSPLPLVAPPARADVLQPDTDEPTGPCFQEEDDHAHLVAVMNTATAPAGGDDRPVRKQLSSDDSQPTDRDDRPVRKPRKPRRRSAEAAQRLPATDAVESDPWSGSEWDEVVSLATPEDEDGVRWTVTDRRPEDATSDDLQALGQSVEAWLEQRAQAKQAEAQDLAGRSVVELRRLAARCGIKNTRTARKADLLTALAGVGV